MSTSAPHPLSTQLGALIHDYPGSYTRLIWIVLVEALAAYGVVASLVQASFGGLLVWLAVGAGAYAFFYSTQRGAHAQIFEHGFVITRGGKTTSVRWEDIANVEHWVKRTKMYFVMTISKSHSYIIALQSGERVKVSWWFRNEAQLGSAIERMWAQTALARRANPPS